MMPSGGPFLAAVVQMRSDADVADNLAVMSSLVQQSADRGASLVATPENTTFFGAPDRKLALAERAGGSTELACAEIAARAGVWLLVGSVAERLDDTRCYNTSLLFGPDGAIRARYRKLHLFDVRLDSGETYMESGHVEPGDTTEVVDTELGAIGLSICYDLRFPELYRMLVEDGALILTVPSAFTVETGRAHWHTLLRARAIENQAYVLAPAQEGTHQNGRRTYGHSLIVDPWGVIVAERAEGVGVVLAEVDLARVRTLRASIPLASHRRLAGQRLIHPARGLTRPTG